MESNLKQSTGVQKFVNQHQYKLMLLLFASGIFFSRTEIMSKAFQVFKHEVEEEIVELEETDEYNINKTRRMIDNGDETTLLKAKVMLLEHELDNCKKE